MEQKLEKNKNVPTVFNKIYHIPRLHLGISLEQACVMDTIDKMSQRQYKDYPTGWCYASKGYFSRFLDMDRVSIQRMVRKLVEYDLLIKGKPIGSNRVVPLRVCDAWKEKIRESERKKDSFTNIYHRARVRLGLSCGEYCILDTLCWIQEQKTFVWHRGTKRWLADRMCMPYSTFANLFQRILRRGFLYPEEIRGNFDYGGNCSAYQVVDDFRYIISEANRHGGMTLDDAIDTVEANAHNNVHWRDGISPELLAEIEGYNPPKTP